MRVLGFGVVNLYVAETPSWFVPWLHAPWVVQENAGKERRKNGIVWQRERATAGVPFAVGQSRRVTNMPWILHEGEAAVPYA